MAPPRAISPILAPRARRSTARNALTAAVITALPLGGCGAGEPSRAPEPTPFEARRAGPDVSSGSPIEAYFPLVDGYIYSYATMNEAGEPGVIIAGVARMSALQGELRFPTGAKRFAYTPEGVISASSGAFVLKEPLAVGATFRGEHGGVTRIAAIDASADVPAGRFTGCVQTIEERLGDRPVRYATTFCPNVGVVVLEATSGLNLERAELKSYAPAVRIGPDGLVRTH